MLVPSSSPGPTSSPCVVDNISPGSNGSGGDPPGSSSTVIPSSPLFASGLLEAAADLECALQSPAFKIDRLYAPGYDDGLPLFGLPRHSTLGTNEPVTEESPSTMIRLGFNFDQPVTTAISGDVDDDSQAAEPSEACSELDQLLDSSSPNGYEDGLNFCDDLTRRLLDVLGAQERTGGLGPGSSQSQLPSRSLSAIAEDLVVHDPYPESRSDLGGVCSASTSVYAADISDFTPSSADSFALTASLCSSFSGPQSCSASSLTSQNSRFDYVIQTPDRFAHKYAIMPALPSENDDDASNVSPEESLAIPLSQALGPCTPQKLCLSVTLPVPVPPGAPRKVQHRIYIQGCPSVTVSNRPAKRSHSQSTASSRFEDRKSTRLNSSHSGESRMPSSA